MGRKGDYFFKRPNSQNWWIRFQYTGRLKQKFGPKKEYSLGTPDRLEAEVRAQPYIFEHKAALLLHRSNAISPVFDDKTIRRGYEPGRKHINAQGEEFYATDDELIFFNEDGSRKRSAPNRVVRATLNITKHEYDEVMRLAQVAYPDNDTEFLYKWIRVRNINDHIKAEALEAWRIFKQITNGKKLKHCKREDGRQLVKKLYELGNKSSTVEKKVGHLRAAVNIGMADDELKYNPFDSVFEKRSDQLDRDILEEHDMDLVRANLHKLSSSDQLLWRILAQTGMRLDEPFQIEREYNIKGVRCIQIGTKTDTSRRFVPLPSSVLPDLPSEITTHLFTGQSETAGKRLRYLLRKLNISYDKARGTGDPRKVIHSLRHRAKDRLRELGCPLDVQYEILGHENKTTAADYGRGSPRKHLLGWIDQIGY